MINDRVKELMDMGYNVRTAYRRYNAEKRKLMEQLKPEPSFDYDKETPKGEWV